MSTQNVLESNRATKVVVATGLLFSMVGVTNRLDIQAQSLAPQTGASTSSTARRFEVVSIKPCKGGNIGSPNGKKGGEGNPPGRILWDPKTLDEECQLLLRRSLRRDAVLFATIAPSDHQ